MGAFSSSLTLNEEDKDKDEKYDDDDHLTHVKSPFCGHTAWVPCSSLTLNEEDDQDEEAFGVYPCCVILLTRVIVSNLVMLSTQIMLTILV